MNAKHNEMGEMNTKFDRNLNIQLESVLLYLLGSSFLLFTLGLTEQLVKEQPGPSTHMSELGRFPVCSPGKQLEQGVPWVLWRSSSTMPVSSPEEAWRKAVNRGEVPVTVQRHQLVSSC